MTKSDKIMKKVRDGEELSAAERKSLSYILDRAKEDKGEGGKVDKVMDKVRKGEELSKSDQKTLAWAIDRSKNAKNESTLEEAKRQSLKIEQVKKMNQKLLGKIKRVRDRQLRKDVEKVNDKNLRQQVSGDVIGPLDTVESRIKKEITTRLNELDKKFNNPEKDSKLKSMTPEDRQEYLQDELNKIKDKIETLSKEVDKINKKAIKHQRKIADMKTKGKIKESFKDKVRKYLPESKKKSKYIREQKGKIYGVGQKSFLMGVKKKLKEFMDKEMVGEAFETVKMLSADEWRKFAKKNNIDSKTKAVFSPDIPAESDVANALDDWGTGIKSYDEFNDFDLSDLK